MKKIEIIEEINEKNLFLRKISLDDVLFFYESLSSKENNITKFLSLGPVLSKDHAKKIIKNYLDYWKKHSQFNYIIEIRNMKDDVEQVKKAGSISIWGISWLHQRAQIGIWLNSKYWNQGLAKKALNLIKIISFNHLKLNRLEAYIALKNSKSIKLFKTCGFIQEGVLRQYLNLKGTFKDAVLLCCLKNAEWQE
ncbi:MAG: N-acetyltransferase [Promethearchaeota archaeon]|nr:MAG: N-acetyltransferase [Candidatus Lokiarchaeota archaeon]